jgi:hypothetical protein
MVNAATLVATCLRKVIPGTLSDEIFAAIDW